MSKNEESNLSFWLFTVQFFISIIIWIVFGLALTNLEVGREELLLKDGFPSMNAYIWIPVFMGLLTYATVIVSQGFIKFGYLILTISQPQNEG